MMILINTSMSGGHTRGKLRPKAWVSGPDYDRHIKYRKWLQQKNQANFRRETWELTFESFIDKWTEHWDERGRNLEDYCMTRHDVEGAWDDVNTIVIKRKEHFQMHRKRQTELGQVRGYKKNGK
jgi:hypothetical protein